MDHKQYESLDLRNIGPKTEAAINDIGINTRAQFDKLGADKVYLLLLEAGQRPSNNLRLQLKGAEQDIDWHILAERENRIRRSRLADQDEP